MKKAIPKRLAAKGRVLVGLRQAETLRVPSAVGRVYGKRGRLGCEQSDVPGRSEAIRRLVELGLKAKGQILI